MERQKEIRDKTKPCDSEQVYDLLEKVFEENASSAQSIKENEKSKTNPGSNMTGDSERIYDLLDRIFRENDSSLKEVKENEMSQAGTG
jgi:DNA-binding NtrC family response regulator